MAAILIRALAAYSIFFVLQMGLFMACSFGLSPPGVMLTSAICLCIFSFFSAGLACYAPSTLLPPSEDGWPDWFTWYVIGVCLAALAANVVAVGYAFSHQHVGSAFAARFFHNGSAALTVASIVATGAVTVAALLKRAP
jgi:hypothetical protein